MNNPTYKRTKIQKEKDQVLIAEKTLKGFSQAMIAAELGITQQQVSKDLMKIRTQWKMEQTQHVDDIINKELQKCDLIEREAWQAWDRSCEEARRRIVKAIGKTSDKNKEEKPSTIEQTTQTEQRDGDPQHLHTVLQSMSRRAKLLGLDRPQRVEQSGTIVMENVSSDAILAEIQKLEAEIAAQEKRAS
jgi:predicted transcriptional regulator